MPTSSRPFIVIEGLPGAGKTTVREKLVAMLDGRGMPVHHVGQHGWLDAEAASLIIQARKGAIGIRALALVEALLADKRAHLAANVRPFLSHRLVIADRLFLSDLCLLTLQNEKTFGRYASALRSMEPLPDLVILLSASVSEVDRRLCLSRKFRRHLDRPEALALADEVIQSVWPERLGLPTVRVQNESESDLSAAIDLIALKMGTFL